MYWVGCTIWTVNSNLSCDIEIGHNNSGAKKFEADWEKIGGRLDFSASEGQWYYWNPSGEERIGVVLFPRKPGERKGSNYGDAEILVTLLDVPEDFGTKLECGEYFSGEGKLHRTGESLYWKMWFPCA